MPRVVHASGQCILFALRGSDFDETAFFAAADLARARALAERRVSVEEFREALAVPISEAERQDVLALVGWFCRRYPTPAERLAYVRRAYERWTHTRPG